MDLNLSGSQLWFLNFKDYTVGAGVKSLFKVTVSACDVQAFLRFIFLDQIARFYVPYTCTHHVGKLLLRLKILNKIKTQSWPL